MRSFRTYADNTGTIDLGAVCHAILALPDMPDAAHATYDPDIGEPSYPGTYPLEVVTDGGGEPLRLMGASEERFSSARLVRKLTGATARSCWRIVLLDEEERYVHVPGLRAAMAVSLANQDALFYGTPRELIDGVLDWEGIPFEQSGFTVHPYMEALRFNFQVSEAEGEGPALAQVWMKSPAARGEVSSFNKGWTLLEEFALNQDQSFSREAPPHGSRVVMTLGAPPLPGVLVWPTVDATLRLP